MGSARHCSKTGPMGVVGARSLCLPSLWFQILHKFTIDNRRYVRMYKCNNNKIRNLMKRWPQPKTRTRFTFVRDPIRRFISGYRELEYRYRCLSGFRGVVSFNTSPLSFLRKLPGSSRRAKTFLAEFLGKNDSGWLLDNPHGSYGHLCPYVVTRGFDSPVYVGKLEDLNNSLAELARVAGVDTDLSAGMDRRSNHASERDIIASVEMIAMQNFLGESPSWVARLVQRYTPDICVFGYNHTPCNDCKILNRLRSKFIPLYK
eukprot:m.90824 g.90824  ORF g.90824 m.90824 type:complete len:260 (+) comp11889_c0_seq3:370-1149(+)